MTSLWIRMGKLREIETARRWAEEVLGVYRTVTEIEAARADDGQETPPKIKAFFRMVRPGGALSPKKPDS
jgi:hypothetical protein